MSSVEPIATEFDVKSYLQVDDKTRHWLYFRNPPRTDEERANSVHKTDIGGGNVAVSTRIHDGRQAPQSGEGALTLDEAGFQLVECSTALSTEDFYAMTTDADLKKRYYDEVAEFVKEELKCDKVVPFHHGVRNVARQNEGGVQGYAVGGPHTDSSAISGDELVLSMCSAEVEEASKSDAGPYKRYLYLNLWRNISDEPIENDHLAMLDERTVVKPDDYIPKDLFGDGYKIVQYGLNARHAANHRWYYFPKMRKEEAILFKQTDSDWTKKGRTCFHMAVHDDRVSTAAPRQSVELRMMCFWRDAAVDSMPTKENLNLSMIRDPAVSAATSVHDASAKELAAGLLGKVPLVGRFFRGVGSGAGTDTFSGKTAEYEDRFVMGLDGFPAWPEAARTWATNEMQRAADAEAGIRSLTTALVSDTTGHFRTKGFSKDDHQKIVEFLLVESEKYRSVCEKHLRPLCK